MKFAFNKQTITPARIGKGIALAAFVALCVLGRGSVDPYAQPNPPAPRVAK